ncbi:methylated-DNA--[protein]-cysteine S-methyltransferase [Kribbella sp. NBC_01505]|uniref:methylated-DNA--[protein]-cysteine S-methyltransferase n=1 Tax=Kribbella sp. NBC_01505 TaxID=2903580 RepID=UPI003866D949
MIVSTRLGELTLVASDNALAGVYFPHHWVKPMPLGERVESDPVLSEAARQLDEYLAGERSTFDLPTTLSGDDFQLKVWLRLQEIPFGATTTYGEIAAEVGGHAQLVGKVVGQNPLSIVIPCHRVVGKNGSLTGYAGGLQRKQLLLDLEEPIGVRLF